MRRKASRSIARHGGVIQPFYMLRFVGRMRRQNRIVSIALGARRIERAHIQRIKRGTGFSTLDQIRIGKEWPSDRDQIGFAGFKIVFGARRVVAAGKDEHAFELLAEGIFDRLRHRGRR